MTGTEISYYFICQRKLWLFAAGLEQEDNSENVKIGKFISETTYERKKHEIKIDDIVIDYFDFSTGILHEIKKSRQMEEAHIWQVKLYLKKLTEKGVEVKKAVLDYPLLKRTREIFPEAEDFQRIEEIEREASAIKNLPAPPPVINAKICKKCAYYELCYI